MVDLDTLEDRSGELLGFPPGVGEGQERALARPDHQHQLGHGVSFAVSFVSGGAMASILQCKLSLWMWRRPLGLRGKAVALPSHGSTQR